MSNAASFLAVQSYEAGFSPTDPAIGLNLALTLDEQEWLDIDLKRHMADELSHELMAGLPALDRYLLDDPYADAFLGDAIRSAFHLSHEACAVLAGAGVDSLLHALAPLARPNGALAVGRVYPDLPRWVALAGLECRSVDLADALSAPASLILLERPAWDSRDISMAELAGLCETAATRNAFVLVDESYANYAPQDFSAAPLVASNQNLIVLRGVSKAYWLGGLRVGACIAPRSAEPLLKNLIPPLLASSLSLALCRRVIELGDITGRLRRRIQEARREAREALANFGLPAPSSASEFLPAFAWHDAAAGVSEALAKHRIRSKKQPFWGPLNAVSFSCRMSIPLSYDRMSALQRLIRAREEVL